MLFVVTICIHFLCFCSTTPFTPTFGVPTLPDHYTTMEAPNAYPNGSRIWFFGAFEVMYGTVIGTVRMANGTQCVTIRVDGETGRPRTLPVFSVHRMPPGH